MVKRLSSVGQRLVFGCPRLEEIISRPHVKAAPTYLVSFYRSTGDERIEVREEGKKSAWGLIQALARFGVTLDSIHLTPTHYVER